MAGSTPNLPVPSTAPERPLRGKLDAILRRTVAALRAQAGGIALWDAARRTFEPVAAVGLSHETAAELHTLLQGAIARLAGQREPFTVLADLEPAVRSASHFGPIIALRLVDGDRTTGLIYLLRPTSVESFAAADRVVLEAFAAQLSEAVLNARLLEELQDEKRRLESLVRNSPIGIVMLDPLCRVVAFNGAMEALTGWSAGEAVGRDLCTLLDLRDRSGQPVCRAFCPLTRENAALPAGQEVTLAARDGRVLDVRLRYGLVRHDDGTPVNAVITVENITEQREAETLRSTFLSMVSHELQTPLSIIKGYAGLLGRAGVTWDPETVRAHAEVIEGEADRLSRLVNDLLDVSRMAASGIELRTAPVDLEWLLRRAVRRLAAGTNSHAIVVEAEPDLPEVLADHQRIEQVLYNLIDNAVKYSPEGGRILVTARRQDGEIAVSVTDRGMGIAAQEQGRVFERFYRGARARDQQISGVGLGLFICQSIVQAHGGRMQIQSQEGLGTTVTFTLPAAEERGTGHDQPATPDRPGGG